jgi:hypothetical protein
VGVDDVTFSAFCDGQTTRIEQDLTARYHAFLRRVFVHEIEQARRARYIRFVSELSPAIARDIAAWRVEA